MKKLICLLAMMIAMTVVGTSTLAQDYELEPLFKYERFEDGTLGYDKTKPVMYYRDSTEQVMVPKNYTQSKEQFKSSWIATIFNINIPTPKSENEFKGLFDERLNEFVDWNMNALIFQVRPLLDSYYPSEFNPTSQYLSGKQGVDVDYDPLQYMIDKTHEAGLEYHAWLNPYRIRNFHSNALIGMEVADAEQLSTAEYIALLNEKGVLADDNFAVLHPEYVIRFNGKLILNPGYSEVIQHVLDTVNELITNYDLDAIHFDDYFYPYDTEKKVDEFNKEDRHAFETYGMTSGYEDNKEGLESWRRDNVTNLIRDLKAVITTHNNAKGRAVQLGISPFGIWEHKAKDETGSNTPVSSTSTFSDSIFADTKKWVQEELIDYLSPQIYWEFAQPAAPYAELTRWWNSVAESKNVHVYTGHANYKMIDNWSKASNWLNPDEVNNQLKFNQMFSNIKGSALFSYRNLLTIDTSKMTGWDKEKTDAQNASIKTLKEDSFSVMPLMPAKPWLSKNDVKALTDVKVTEENQIIITDDVNDNARYYVIYKGNNTESQETTLFRPENIVSKIFSTGKGTYTYDLETLNKEDRYYVSVLDRAFVETTAFNAFLPNETPLVPLEPSTPVKPVEPEVPEVPEVPETPVVPKVPEVPETPVVPETPTTPEVPETQKPETVLPGKDSTVLPNAGVSNRVPLMSASLIGLGLAIILIKKKTKKHIN